MAGKLSFHFPLLACCPVQHSSSTQIVNWAFPPALLPQQPYLSFLPISFPAGIVLSHQFGACSLALKVHQSATDELVEGKSKDLSMSGDSIRRRFLDFYATRGHKVLPSASLVPDDPTVLITIAGMLQFKPIFLDPVQVPRQVPCATTAQRCIRTNDVENVGRTTRHHTFFEMLGNFSFGDYFKKEAIQWAWDLSTVEFGLPANRLWISVFEDDNEAFEIWHDKMGVPLERIKRMGSE